MKNLIPFILIAFIAIACAQKNTVVISGKITNPADEPTGLRINYFDRNDTITVNADGTFYAEIGLEEEHLVWFGHGRYAVPLYLIPGAQINLTFDAEESEGWIYSNAKITGKKSAASAFLYSLDLKLNKPLTEEIVKMKVKDFATIMNNLEQSSAEDIRNYIAKKSPSVLFTERIWLKQQSELAIKYFEYVRHNQYLLSNEKSVYKSFQEFINAIPANDVENCKEISEYHYFLYQYNEDRINNLMKESGLYKETKAYINELADEIVALDVPQEIKDDIGRRHFSVFYKRPDSLREVYVERYYDVVKNQEYINKFKEHVAIIERTKPGSLAPPFNYSDISGNMISSESLKGKVIYIDVWATWCGPCIGEIPHQKKLEKELHGEDIAFVSISIDKDRVTWEEMVKDKELGGCQLYAEEEWETEIIKEYGITGIPRFIIVDKEGKIVEANATRPSNPETKEKLLNLAQS